MEHPAFYDGRATEHRNPASEAIDVASAIEIVEIINREDRSVPQAVWAARDALAAAIEIAVACLRAGGRLIYVGAGTSGRLGVLDAAECPPTFGSPPDMVMGIIAGGYPALVAAQEGVEDDVEAGRQAMATADIAGEDLVVGIAASGTTPFVRAALLEAVERGVAAALITCSRPPVAAALITCSRPPEELVEKCEVIIQLDVGPEVLTGSTRMKAGTATKLALNTLSTGAMLRLGKAYGNLMVDLMATSQKLIDRGERIVMEVTGADRTKARETIDRAGGSVKLAIVMAKLNVDLPEAKRLVDAADVFVRPVIGEPPPVAR
jgi:N-acetylmuramic acid 6-phosphate etherase